MAATAATHAPAAIHDSSVLTVQTTRGGSPALTALIKRFVTKSRKVERTRAAALKAATKQETEAELRQMFHEQYGATIDHLTQLLSDSSLHAAINRLHVGASLGLFVDPETHYELKLDALPTKQGGKPFLWINPQHGAKYTEFRVELDDKGQLPFERQWDLIEFVPNITDKGVERAIKEWMSLW
jgi:hypothetical protein